VNYDANGNQIGDQVHTNYVWNVENRMVQQLTPASGGGWYGGTGYSYDPSGRRAMKNVNADPAGTVTGTGYGAGTWEFYLYGLNGRKMATIDCGYATGHLQSCQVTGQNAYFAGQMIAEGGWSVVTDRLGSVRANGYSDSGNIKYFPYGAEQTATTEGVTKFATYIRDAVGQDYAEQRYYSAGIGRFWSVDPGGIATSNPRNPISWNRYAYVNDDPVNIYDPSGGIANCPPGTFPAGTGFNMYCASPNLCDDAPLLCMSYGPAYGSPGNTSGAGGLDSPTLLNEWANLSTECQQALESAPSLSGPNTNSIDAQRVHALNRAISDEGWLGQAVAGMLPVGGADITWELLAAIGIEETGFRNIPQAGGGQGAGVFQIDLGANPSVSRSQAFDIQWSADWAANYLYNNMTYLATQFPNLSPTQLLQATAASYNLGPGGISGNPNTIDVGTTPGNLWEQRSCAHELLSIGYDKNILRISTDGISCGLVLYGDR
jgi:RHS repeat-associated protein